MKAALEEQRKLTQEVCEASGRKNEAMEKQKEKEMEDGTKVRKVWSGVSLFDKAS